MIHPFARFSAVPTANETLWDRAALLERPAVEFAAFLKAGQSATRAPAELASGPPQRAASNLAGTAAVSPPPSPPSTASQQTANAQPLAAASPIGSTLATPVGSENARSENTLSQHTEVTPPASPDNPPRFTNVPDSAKYPAGPYRQAPPEYGAEWWLVNPFTGDAPWLNQDAAGSPTTNPGSKYATENLPQDFLQAFGGLPARRAGDSGAEFAGRVARWKQDLEFFQRSGIPDGLDESQVERAAAAYEQWGMGRPVFYEGRYGWFARFPDSAIPDFEMDAASAVQTSHLAIARFQVRLLRQGAELPTAHPFVPPHLLPQNT
jgi:hypothetical protein